MQKRLWVVFALIMIVPGLLFMVSCGKKKIASDPSSVTQPSGKEGVGGKGKDSAAGKLSDEELAKQKALEEQRRKEEEAKRKLTEDAKRKLAEEQARFENEDIYFEFDSSTLLPAAQEVLKKKVAYLKTNPKINVVIEGHCDERGTNEYNLALGDRRAKSALAFLANLGVETSRMTAISYGEERPLDAAHSEEAWAKNRRAHTVIE